jgi:hypothetical protein
VGQGRHVLGRGPMDRHHGEEHERRDRKWSICKGLAHGTLGRTAGHGTVRGSRPCWRNSSLHYVFDLWGAAAERRHAWGETIVTRYADDFIVGFASHTDALVSLGFQTALRDRFGRFVLDCRPRKRACSSLGDCGPATIRAATGQASDLQLPELPNAGRTTLAARLAAPRPAGPNDVGADAADLPALAA